MKPTLMECVYCQKTSKQTPIFPKPLFFESRFTDPNSVYGVCRFTMHDEGKPVCLKCLESEMKMLADQSRVN